MSTPLSRWLSQEVQEEPWNAVDAVIRPDGDGSSGEALGKDA